jgi:hypothetical protein
VRPATNRGTQRLYGRLNTLHYLLAVLHSIDRSSTRRSTRGCLRRACPAGCSRSARKSPMTPTQHRLASRCTRSCCGTGSWTL